MTVHWQPKGYPNVIPCLTVRDAAGLMEFICRVFQGEAAESIRDGDALRHGEVRVGDSMIMLAEASERYPATGSSIHMYVPDVDAAYRNALDNGATSAMEVGDRFYGDRSGGVKDAWGNTWWLATHVEDVSPAEIQRRSQATK